MVIVVRHFSTVFTYDGAIWAKYSTVDVKRINFNDPQTNQPPKSTSTTQLRMWGRCRALATRWIHAQARRAFAVCQMATRLFSAGLAQATGGTAEAVYNEVVGNLVANSHIVPAIVAISRAQERGYTFASVV